MSITLSLSACKQRVENTDESSFRRFLRNTSICSCIILIIFSIGLFIASLIAWEPSATVSGFYLILGSILLIIADIKPELIGDNLGFLKNPSGNAVFHLIIGSITFATLGIFNVFSVFLIIIGCMVILVGMIKIIMEHTRLQSLQHSEQLSQEESLMEFNKADGDIINFPNKDNSIKDENNNSIVKPPEENLYNAV